MTQICVDGRFRNNEMQGNGTDSQKERTETLKDFSATNAKCFEAERARIHSNDKYYIKEWTN